MPSSFNLCFRLAAFRDSQEKRLAEGTGHPDEPDPNKRGEKHIEPRLVISRDEGLGDVARVRGVA
jgi:hypothetical protein